MFLDRERFMPAAEMRLSRDKSSIRVTITDPKVCELGEAVYVWITAEDLEAGDFTRVHVIR